jgi:membrane associated rhomboid family serine protease
MRTPESWRAAPVTIAIAAATAFAWLVAVVLRIEPVAAVWGGFIPDRVTGLPGDDVLAPVWLTPLTATLVHGGIVHLLFNLLILLFCGRAIEPIVGRAGLLILYVVGAYAAAAAHFFVNFETSAPMIGASGAISAVLGAYALLFGRNKVNIANQRLAILLHALWLGAAWVVLQLLTGFAFETLGTRIAIAAHIGGFLAGLLLAKPLLLLRYRNA